MSQELGINTKYIFSFNFFVFNWRIIALQYCVGFCHTSTWIHHWYRYVPSIINLPSIPLHSYRLSQSPSLSSWVNSTFPLAIYFTYGSVNASVLLSPFVPPSPSSTCPHVHKSVLYVCVFIAALQICSSNILFILYIRFVTWTPERM